MPEIMQWNDIKGDFKDALLVGNGGSIALSDKFSYKSLYGYADKHELLQKEAIAVFDKFQKKYRDFEQVLYSLWQADYINGLFDVAEDEQKKVRLGYTKVRRSLIDAVKDVHPANNESELALLKVGQFTAGFKTVFSLNYDLMLFWASQKVNVNDINDGNKFIDGFTLRVSRNKSQKDPTFAFTDNIEELRVPNHYNESSTLVFYPHGSLLLYQTKAKKDERKITSYKKEGLLKSITDFWARNDGNPIFVCEGDSEQKLKAISASKYLTHVYQNVLPRAGKTLTIYGWGMGDQDSHIVKQLARGSYEKVAVSIHTQNKSPKQLAQMMNTYQHKLEKIVLPEHVEFFDSASLGCWKY
jgi:hypothetical protein